MSQKAAFQTAAADQISFKNLLKSKEILYKVDTVQGYCQALGGSSVIPMYFETPAE